ncbi:hypothetical protein PR202_gb13353 [Eleusine coracana subsp. coracana]|uniref:Uncharacterized protein n=1 Tax=Eleusine coracana subsp. coracana TaxID=191504 RepID=A0AAV5ETJ3_ELECO|nr:hypothetical protein PR202_gb13353 [Eleusine coracana subsp. coracana]
MTTTLAFAVRRKEPVLVRPAAATPTETKHLSDLDNQVFIRKHVASVFFYRGGVRDDGADPAAVIRRALGEALVPYYPLAGRLREVVESRRLVVDCSGEGVVFVEADADVRLVELEAAGLRPPYPCVDQLLFNNVIEPNNGPLLLIQKHDDALPPSSLLMQAPPPPPPGGDSSGTMVTRTFTFGPLQIAAIKASLSGDTATTFEALTAALWRARTAALRLRPEEETSVLFTFNLRGVRKLGLPAGYYGNAIVIAAARAAAGELLDGSSSSLAHAVALVKEAKDAVRSDPLALQEWARLVTPNNHAAFLVSDTRCVGFHRMDFGWGAPVCGGRAEARHVVSSFLELKINGSSVVAVPVLLPPAAMDRFAAEVETMMLMLSTTPVPVKHASPPVPQARL